MRAFTPHVIVDASRDGVEVPSAYVKDGKIVLNVSMNATQRLQLLNHGIEFDARFAGVVHHVRVPIAAVLGIYARETGEGMVFNEGEPEAPPPSGDTSCAHCRRSARRDAPRETHRRKMTVHRAVMRIS